MRKYVSDNLLNLVSIFIGVVGSIIGVVLYYRSKRIRFPAYVDAWRTRIVDKRTTNTPGLQVLHDGQAITGKDVTSLIVYFWNGGREPIRKADVLRQYAFFLGEDGTMLHADIVRSTRSECGIKILFPHPMTNRIALEFDALEYGDGVAVQLIFSGEPETPIVMDGTCIGAETIRNATADYKAGRFRIGKSSPRITNALAPLFLGVSIGVRTFTNHSYFDGGLGAAMALIGVFNLVPIIKSYGMAYYGSLKRLTK